jgi:hypothetical protein
MATRSPSPPPVYLRPIVWLAYAVLFAAAVPWYWPADTSAQWLGLPLWVVVTLAGSFLISGFTAWLFLFAWPEDDSPGEDQL